MPVDALFESMVGCAMPIGFGLGGASEGARFGKRPLHKQTQEGGLKPPLQRLGAASEKAPRLLRRLGLQPQRTSQQECGALAPEVEIADVSLQFAISTTKSGQSVVENHPSKSPLKVLVEAFLLAFCPTCRRADIFHNECILGRQNTNPATNSVPKPAVSRFSVVFPSERLLLDLTKEARRAPFHQSKSKRGIS
jgi:hypothetical protein